VKIRADIFRPQDDVKVPVLIAWSPSGKTGRDTSFMFIDMKNNKNKKLTCHSVINRLK
jgi:predicted acyl esterase